MAETEDRVEPSAKRGKRWAFRVGAAVVIVAVLLLAALAVRTHVRSRRPVTAEEILQQVCDRYAGLESLEVDGNMCCDSTVFDRHWKDTHRFSMKLHRSGMYCVIWHDSDPLGTHGPCAVWDCGDGQHVYVASANAYGPTGAAPPDLLSDQQRGTGLARQLFLLESDPKEWLQGFLEPRLVGEDVAEGRQCYLIEGHDAQGNRQSLWVSKDGWLVVQQEIVIEQEDLWRVEFPPDLTAEKIGAGAGVPGKLLQKLVGGVMLWKMKRDVMAEVEKGAPANRGVRIVITTAYSAIRTNADLKATDFAFSVPGGATLDEDLWRQIAAHQEAAQQAARAQAEAAAEGSAVGPGAASE